MALTGRFKSVPDGNFVCSVYMLIVCLLKEPDFTGVYHPDPYDNTDDDNTDDDDSQMKGAVFRVQL